MRQNIIKLMTLPMQIFHPHLAFVFTLHCAYQQVTSEAKPKNKNHLITAYVMEMKSQTWLVIYIHFDTSPSKKI
jgi:hypothetical protein